MAESGGREMELRDYLRVLQRRRKLLLIIVGVVFAGAVAGSLLQTPVYASEAEVLLQRRSTEALFENSNGPYVDPLRTIQTEIKVVTSYPVRLLAREKLGFDARITASAAGQANVIVLHAEDSQAKRAADIANAYARAYIDFRRQEAVDDVLAGAQEVQGKINDLQKQIDSSAPPLQQTYVEQLALFKDKLNELQVNAALQTGGAQVVGPATPSDSPIRPKPIRNAIVGLGLGAFLGVGTVFLADHLDDSVKTKEDLERAEPSLPVIGVIPAVTTWKAREEPLLVSISDPNSAAAEAYRTLRTSIQFPLMDRTVRTLQVTSANAHEGKTTTLANLGVALAATGYRVVIVCCDLRRPRVHEFFGLDNSLGFTSVLVGEVPVAKALQRVRGVERLYVLPSGPPPPNPSELLQSRRAAEILRSVEGEGTFVLVDSPPVLPVTDALVLSKRVHATVLVCSAGTTGRKEVSRAAEMLRQVRAPLIGVVLNGVADERIYGGRSYGYYSSYVSNGNGSKVRDLGPRRSSPPKRASS